MLKFFSNHPEILAVMSLRSDGSMRLIKGDEKSFANHKAFLEKIGVPEKMEISAGMAHGNKVKIISSANERIVFEHDGLATNTQGIFLSITVSDCIPVFFYDPVEKIIAIAHAGWRGIVGNIAKNTILKMEKLGSKPQNIKISLGPGISQKNFEIKEDVLEEFESYSDFIQETNRKFFINLKGIIKKQLSDLGILPENIEDSEECTFDNPEKYFSFRKDEPGDSGVMLAVIGIL